MRLAAGDDDYSFNFRAEVLVSGYIDIFTSSCGGDGESFLM